MREYYYIPERNLINRTVREVADRLLQCTRQGHTHLSPSDPLWIELCRQVTLRDGYLCRRCGTSRGVKTYHKTPLESGGTNSLDNLHRLCALCAGKKGEKRCEPIPV